jgi:ParB family transcriptional regulator, chromosome partitioning protein
VPVGPAGVRATATAGKVELRADMDFSAIDRDRLEAAIEAFFAALEQG